MTGIKSRFLYQADSPPSEGAVRAARRLFAAGFDPNLINRLYSTSVGRDFLEPSTASVIQSRLGLGSGVKSLDLGSACLGFMDGLELAAMQIDSGYCQYALVVAGENNRVLLENTISRLLEPDLTVKEFFQNFATLTLGSGGAAMIVGPAELHPGSPLIKNMVSRSDATSNHLCRGDWSGMVTDSTALLQAGVSLALETYKEGEKYFGWQQNSFDLIISHQVSEVNTQKFCQALNLSWDKLVKTYPQYGNMGPVAVPFAFDLAYEKGLITGGTNLALVGIGSGLCCALMEIYIP
jgi:3-oxoacyl-[acyl-carrier-protein] synthase-3